MALTPLDPTMEHDGSGPPLPGSGAFYAEQGMLDDEGIEEEIQEIAENGGVHPEDEDEGAEIAFDEESAAKERFRGPAFDRFDDNLANFLDERVLRKIGRDVVEWVEVDEESRTEWADRFKNGLRTLGVIREPDAEELFPGSSTIVHPLMAEAVVQFQARAIEEMFPAAGPVKAVVLGDRTDEKQEQADRVADYMNYQVTVEDESYFWELDQMLFYLPIGGSAFKKVFRDPLCGINRSIFIMAADLIVPYTAKSLQTASRYTHRVKMDRNTILQYQQIGEFRKVEIPEPSYETRSEEQEAIDEADDRTETDNDEDTRNQLYESYCLYDIPGFEDRDAFGEKTGIKLPYIITVERDSGEVLKIRRNWKASDRYKRKRHCIVHYKYLPGLGFYGFGLIHMIGGLAEGATETLRALLDSASFSNLQGGFKSKDAKLSGETMLAPGKWVDTDMSAEELSKAFYTPPWHEPSPAMFQLLGLMVESGQRFASTTEAMVGDASNTGPVGTTVALIEQGSKVFSGIHKRLHRAQGQEFRIAADLNAEHLPDEYPYDVEGASRTIMRSDFDGRVDVLPVSDPNIFSSTQRIAQSQSVVQLAKENPGLYRPREVQERMLHAMRIPDPDSLLVKKADVPRRDPITENMCLLTGKAVKAYPDQDHQGHLLAVMSLLQNPTFAGNPEAAKIVGPAAMAHAAEHLAYLYQQRLTGLGIPMIPVDLSRGDDDEDEDEDVLEVPMDPATDAAIASMVASLGDQLMQIQGLPGGGQQDEAKAQAEAKVEIMKMEAAAKQQIEEQRFLAEESRKQRAWEAEQARLDQAAKAVIVREHEIMQANLDLAASEKMHEHATTLTEVTAKAGAKGGSVVSRTRETDGGGGPPPA